MQMQGVLEQVETVQARSFASAAASVSDTVIYVDDVTALLTATGDCTVDIDGVQYAATPNDGDNSLTLSPALSVAVAEGDPVALVPAAESTWAWVSFPGDDDTGDPIQCLVPHYLKSYRAMSVGPKDGDDRVAVVIETQPEPVVVNVPNEPVLIDAADIDPSTTVPPAALTDGLPPSASPTPTLERFAVGGLKWSVTPVPNADPVRFKIYADTVDPPTQDAAHQVGDSSSTSGFFGEINGVRLLDDDPTIDVTYYVAVVEYDADGEAAMGPTSNPAIPRRADGSDIAVDYIYGNRVEANQIAAGKISTIVLNVGDFIDLDGPNSFLTIWKNSDRTVVGTQLRSDGSVFRGRVEADNVDVSGQLTLHDTGHVATNGELILDNGVGDPAAGPTLTATPSPSTFPAPPSGYLVRGICWDAANTRWLRLIRTATTAKVEKINTSGVVTSTTTLDGGSSVNSIVVIGSNWYTMYKSDFGTGVSHWRARRFNTSGTLLQTHDGSIPIFGDWPCVGTDGTNLLVAAQTASAVSVLTWSASDLDTLISSYTWSGTFADSSLGFVGKDNFDFGASRIVINAGAEVHAFSLSGSTLTEVTAKAFVLPSSSFGGGFAWDGTYFYSSHGAAILYRYTNYYPGVGDNAYVAYTDTDTGSGNHTKASPISSVALLARWSVQVALGTVPAGAATPKVYAKIATSAPAVTALLVRSETITSRNTLIDPATAGGSTLGTDSNTFGAAGTPGEISSQSGGFVVDGAGEGSWPLLGTSDQKILSADANPTSTTNVNMTSLNMTATVKSTSDVVWVTISAEIATAVANSLNIIELLIDGAAESVQLRTRLQSANDRYSGSKQWRITGLAAGAHTIAFRTRNSAGSTDVTVTSAHTVASYWTTT